VERGQRFRFSGAVDELLGISLVNLALTIVTLGIYRFWARVRVRRYLWSHMGLGEEPFEYTGTGPELFVGFLIAVFGFIVPLTLAFAFLDFVIQSRAPGLQPLSDLTFSLGFLFLLGVALYRARRYRFSRTLWRGIRFAQTGPSATYGGLYLGYMLLSLITLGWFVPVKNLRLWSFALNHSYYGGVRFRFESLGHTLYRPFARSWLLFLPTLGLSYFWYKAAEFRVIAERTRFQDLRFEFAPSGGRLLGHVALNVLLFVLTLSLGTAFIQRRNARFVAANLTVIGEPDFEAISQSMAAMPGIGEGLAEAFDVGAV
jgi:uncharacterized membrane protein YjgN (DUF898 family)